MLLSVTRCKYRLYFNITKENIDIFSILIYMRIIDRLDQYMKRMNINDNQITVNCSLSVGLIGKARSGKTDIGKKAIEKILNFYQDINQVWLLTGEGSMTKEEQNSAENENRMVIVSAEAWDLIKKQAEIISRQSESIELKDQQINDLISSLKKTNALEEENAKCAAASGSDLQG